MAEKPKLEDCSRVLIVEGYSDLAFYAEFLEFLAKDKIFIHVLDGSGNIKAKGKSDRAFKTFLSPAVLEKEVIAIILDADASAKSTFDSTQMHLERFTGQRIRAIGEWTEGTPRLGIFVVPNGTDEGEMETLIWKAWSSTPENQEAAHCVTSFLACMETAGLKSKSPDKGRVGAILAILNDEDPRPGPGARSNHFDFTRPEYDALRTFLSAL
jgi:hypothetical protein